MVTTKFVPGMVNEINYGGPWGSDSALITFYGDILHPSAQFAMDAATAQHPDEACLADHQKVAVNFRFGQPRPYGDVRDLFDKVAEKLEVVGWAFAPTIDGIPDSRSSIDDLVENPEWPIVEGLDDMTGAEGFTFIVEKVGTKPAFSDEEVAQISDLAKQAMIMVFGTELSASD